MKNQDHVRGRKRLISLYKSSILIFTIRRSSNQQGSQRMEKRILKLIVMSVLVGFFSVAFAQSFLDFGSKRTNAAKATAAPGTTLPTPTPALSPDEFKSKVNILQQQTKTNLTQQLNQELTARPPIAPPGPGSATTPAAAPSSTAPGASTSTTLPETPVIQAPVTTTPAAPISPAATPTTRPETPITSPVTAPTTAPSQPATQPYTGFGTGTSSGTTGGTSKPSGSSGSGGWNIRY